MDETVRTGDGRVRPAGFSGHSRRSPAVSGSTRDRLVRLAYRFLWDLNDAEDVVQEALITAHEKIDDLRNDFNWWSWICQIVVNSCRERGRRAQRREKHEESLRLEVLGRSGEPGPAGPSDFKDVVRTLVCELPRRQREVIVLRHLQDMSYEEIASVLDIAPATARVHARAGREALRRMLLEHHPELLD
jgi:RNA polymerase sigma-70 factor (ECF subfamily)